jgi:serine protease Do
MKPVKLLTLFVVAGMFSLHAPSLRAATPDDPGTRALRALGDAFANVSQQVKPAVVSIHAEKVIRLRQSQMPFGPENPLRFFFDNQGDQPMRRPPPERQFRQQGLGSGIIVDKLGHILTNNHVVQDVDKLTVTLADKRSFDAEVVGTDPHTDIAVIKLKGKIPADLPVAELGNSNSARVGEWVLAIGAPFGYEQTVTAGIISAKGRSNVVEPDMYQDFLQTDAAINPGNSGGPLVDLDGKVIGINTVIATGIGQNAGVGFAIPINMAKDIMPVLFKGGTINRGLLGVGIQEVTPDLATAFNLPNTKGALVTQVVEDSAAAKAGIKVEDVITKFNGKEVEDTSQLRNLVASCAPGTEAAITLVRKDKEMILHAKLGTLPNETEASEEGGGNNEGAGKLGLGIAPLTPDKAKQLGYKNTVGVVVTEVDDDSPAANAGLRPGDVITEVNRMKVTSISDFREALAKSKDKENVLMLVKRQDRSSFIIVQQK